MFLLARCSIWSLISAMRGLTTMVTSKDHGLLFKLYAKRLKLPCLGQQEQVIGKLEISPTRLASRRRCPCPLAEDIPQHPSVLCSGTQSVQIGWEVAGRLLRSCRPSSSAKNLKHLSITCWNSYPDALRSLLTFRSYWRAGNTIKYGDLFNSHFCSNSRKSQT